LFCGENCKFIGFLDGNLNYKGMHFDRLPFSRVAFPEQQLLFDTFSGPTMWEDCHCGQIWVGIVIINCIQNRIEISCTTISGIA